jgi:N-acetylneuraminate synthase
MNPLDQTQSTLPSIRIGDQRIGRDHPTYVVAEIGINHNGDPGIARKLIDTAADARVDAVKFQKRHLPSLYPRDVLEETTRYEQNFQYMIPILKEVELREDDLADLKAYAGDKGLEFLCTPFDRVSADFLDDLGTRAFKIASADLNNTDLLEHVAAKKKPIILSTGMSYWDEIKAAVGLLKGSGTPFALLHCRSVYPVWPREVNLQMINRLESFGVPVGYSGHDIGITIPLVAASMGASIIEKHITLDRHMRGPDHKISLEGFELKRLVRDIRVADQAMGRQKRFLLRGEILNRELFGKSLKAAVAISKGTPITQEMIRVQGPGKGLPPHRIRDLVGREAPRDLAQGDLFLDEDLNGGHTQGFSASFRSRWGLISRFGDMDEMLALGPRLIEFHLTEKDIQLLPEIAASYEQELVVHAPEYMGDRLLDLCSGNLEILDASLALVHDTIELTTRLAPHFKGRPKVIVHPGAMSLNRKLDRDTLRSTLLRSLEAIDPGETELLFENLPPYPWYFGGQWKGNYFMDGEEIRSFCEETGLGLCFDLSHAALFCNAKEKDLAAFIREVMPFIRHIHFADGYGLDGEGVQLGQGEIDLDAILPLFSGYEGTWVPEIWRGHLNHGRGFVEALEFLSRYDL